MSEHRLNPNETHEATPPYTFTEIQILTFRFNQRHKEIFSTSQMLCLTEEIGELAEAINVFENMKIASKKNPSKAAIAEEIGDIMFLAISIAELYDINAKNELDKTVITNLQK